MDLCNFITYLRKRGNAAASVSMYIAAVNKFYTMNDVTTLNWKKIKSYQGEHEKVAEDRPYTHSEIQTLIAHTTPRNRAIILLMSSAGLRLGAIPILGIRDIIPLDKYQIYKVNVYAKSKKSAYFSFCTPECRKEIDSYLDYRRRWAERITDESPLFRSDYNIQYYKEAKGIFVNNADVVIRSKLESEFGLKFSNKDVSEFLGHIERRNFFDRSDFNPDIEWLPLEDCVINLKTQQIRPHSPAFLATVQVPVSYYYHGQPNPIIDFFEWIEDPLSVRCPNIMKFMYEVMAPDDVEIVLDIIAYCLWRSLPFHKYLLFNGSGRNGKGTMLAVIKAFLGGRNVSGESLHRLLNNRFSTSKLYGKLANIHADLSNEALKDTGILKMLTGGDPIPAEEKFKTPFWFINTSKLLFSANEIPETSDESDAFFARPIIINFPNQFLGDKADPHLLTKLTTKAELSGLLRVVLRRLPRVLEKGIAAIAAAGPEIIERNYDKYMLSSNPIRAFIEKCTRLDDSSRILKDDVYDTYRRFCNHHKLGVEGSFSFSRKLKGEFSFKDIQGTDRRYYWIGHVLTDFTGTQEGQVTLTKFSWLAPYSTHPDTQSLVILLNIMVVLHYT